MLIYPGGDHSFLGSNSGAMWLGHGLLHRLQLLVANCCNLAILQLAILGPQLWCLFALEGVNYTVWQHLVANVLAKSGAMMLLEIG